MERQFKTSSSTAIRKRKMVHAVQCGNLYSHKRLFIHNVMKLNAMSCGNLSIAKERRQLYCFCAKAKRQRQSFAQSSIEGL